MAGGDVTVEQGMGNREWLEGIAIAHTEATPHPLPKGYN